MYHVAICDDDKEFITFMKNVIEKANDKSEYELKILEYVSGKELLLAVENCTAYDLLILDAHIGGMDGYQIAEKFRKKFPETVMVFCSRKGQPTVNLFKIGIFRYLLKSNRPEMFVFEMKEILLEMERKAKEPFLIGHYRGNYIKVRIKNILYIENAKRGSRIIVSENCSEAKFAWQILVDEKIKDLSDRFEELVFAHSSYIVNIYHVETVNSDELLLDSGERLSVSREYHKIFKEAFRRGTGG